jgi:hypothetical protein
VAVAEAGAVVDGAVLVVGADDEGVPPRLVGAARNALSPVQPAASSEPARTAATDHAGRRRSLTGATYLAALL